MNAQRPPTRASRESGFALILALLSLVLLTTIGLALSSSSSIEFQISMNHRWSEQARHNAEAGIDFGRRLLANANWSTILPPARAAQNSATAWGGTLASVTPPYNRADEFANATRNFESWRCDSKGYGLGYGVVLDDGTSEAPYQYKTDVGGFALNGAFSLWVRRPVHWSDSTGATLETGTYLKDYEGNDALILVAEGIAPYTGAQVTSALGAANRSTYMIEVLLTSGSGSTTTAATQCGSRQGQSGSASSGAGFGGCAAVTGGTSVTRGLAGGTDLGTGNLK